MRALVLAHAVALGLALVSAPAQADYKDSYSRGLKAARDGEWGEVEARMRAALSEKATPLSVDRFPGNKVEPYVPQFFLGIAAAKLGNCNAAVSNLEHGPTRAAVSDGNATRKLGEFIGMAESGLSDCRRRLAGGPTTTPVSPTTTPPKNGTPTTTPTTTTTTTPTTTPVANVPKPNPPPTTTTPTTTPPKPVVVATAPKPPPTAPTPAPTPPPAALQSAIDAYLLGRYAQAAGVDPATLPDKRARFHALLVRAAARHTESLLQGTAGTNLLTLAQADVRAAKALEPAIAPDPSLFSPRFRQFYSATR